MGTTSRLRKLVAFFDKDTTVREIVSGRGFTTATGKMNGVDLSIVSIGMGYPMMDFFVRESRAVVHGPMAIVRYVLVKYYYVTCMCVCPPPLTLYCNP